MKTIIYLLIWLNCSCPVSNIILTDTYTGTHINTSGYQMPYDKPSCDTRIEFADTLDALLDQMAKEHNAYGLVQPRTVPDRIYKLTLKGGKVIDKEPVEIEPVIEKSKVWIEQEEKTIKGFKVK